MKKFLCVVCAALLLCTGLAAQDAPYVILVSFDGFRHDYVERFNLPRFKEFIGRGSSSKGLIPSFPSKTFPNHYSLVTGLYPGNHGLVNNEFYDPAKEEFYSMDLKQRLIDPYYYSGTPLWKLAMQNHIKCASFFWVGSEIPDEGFHPDYYLPYEESVPFEDRVDQVFEWLRLPERERPHFITLYFSSPDHESHRFGPLSAEARAATVQMDNILGQLMDGLNKLDLPVNVLLVSDHGLKELKVKDETYIFLDEIMNINDPSVIAVNAGSQVHFYLRDEAQKDSLAAALKSVSNNFSVLEPKEFPAEWHYDHERVGDLLIVAHSGHYFRDKDRATYMRGRKRGDTFGVHGYDPDSEQDMVGIFYANGPNIKKGIELPAFRNVHVYPLIARILNVSTPPVDGKMEILLSIYQQSR
ncbi:MAG TPA: ectonucleotide pyrophosphatase/phosphodiesterase [Cyclobacteriaceae bacterium]